MVFLLVCACSKETEVILKDNTAVAIQFVDNGGNPIPDVQVKFFDYFESDFYKDNFFYQGKSDANGTVSVGGLNKYIFRMIADSIPVGKFKYVPMKDYQAIRGKDNSFQVNVESYSGVFKTYAAVAYAPVYELKPAVGFKIAILPNGYVGEWDAYIQEKTLDKAVYLEDIGDDGRNSFYLPERVDFTLVIFEPQTLRIRNVSWAAVSRFTENNSAIINMTIYPES